MMDANTNSHELLEPEFFVQLDGGQVTVTVTAVTGGLLSGG